MHIVNRDIRQYLYHLDDIYNHRWKTLSSSKLMLVYCVNNDYVKYWRQLDQKDFYGLSNDSRDELYYWFNKKMMEISDLHLDLYWLTFDYDSKPLYMSGREPDKFWRLPFCGYNRFPYV